MSRANAASHVRAPRACPAAAQPIRREQRLEAEDVAVAGWATLGSSTDGTFDRYSGASRDPPAAACVRGRIASRPGDTDHRRVQRLVDAEAARCASSSPSGRAACRSPHRACSRSRRAPVGAPALDERASLRRPGRTTTRPASAARVARRDDGGRVPRVPSWRRTPVTARRAHPAADPRARADRPARARAPRSRGRR